MSDHLSQNANATVRGKVVLITGASAGVGLAAALELARSGAEIAIVGRSESRGEQARARIAEVGTEPSLFVGDLSVQADVRRLAAEISDRYDHLDVLVNNAGGMFSAREETIDGIERTFATNHLGPFLLTELLLPLVLAAPQGRIVNVSSETYSGKLDFENLQGERKYHFMGAYQRSKTANVLFTNELARRLGGTGVTVNAVSPGPTRTGFGDATVGGVFGAVMRVMKNHLPMFGSPEKGAATYLYAIASPDLDGTTGRFFYRSAEKKPKSIAADTEAAARLWTISERLTGIDAATANTPADR